MSEGLPTIYLSDSLTDDKRPLETYEAGRVKMYVCGLTVYDYSHIGHARTFIVFDVIRRYLQHRGYTVRFVCNHTDVDDKIIKRANEVGEDPLALAERFIVALEEDMAALHLLPPDVAPRVSREIDAIIQMVEQLIARGYAYAVDGDVFFEVSRFDEYGKLSKKVLDDLRAGERVDVDERKRSPADFALWKAAKPGEPHWSSPWGEGRPGWHIECSVMSTKYLGDSFDLHGGGRDLIFPHHENEIAQSEAATGQPFVSYWLHAGPLTIDGEKMSKSLGNFWTVRDVLATYHPDVIRYFMLTAHYRKPVNYSEEALDEARRRLNYFAKTLDRVRRTLELSPEFDREGKIIHGDAIESFWDDLHAVMDDDFNTPKAFALLYRQARLANELLPPMPKKVKDPSRLRALARLHRQILEAGQLFGLFQDSPAHTLTQLRELRVRQRGLSTEDIEARIAERTDARKARNFERADQIRDGLAAQGVTLMDSPAGTEWEVD